MATHKLITWVQDSGLIPYAEEFYPTDRYKRLRAMSMQDMKTGMLSNTLSDQDIIEEFRQVSEKQQKLIKQLKTVSISSAVTFVSAVASLAMLARKGCSVPPTITLCAFTWCAYRFAMINQNSQNHRNMQVKLQEASSSNLQP